MAADEPNRQRARRHALRARLAQADLAALLVTKPVNVRYLTGFSGSYGALLLLHDRTLFFTDRRYERHASARVGEAELVMAPGGLIGAVAAVLGPLDEGLGFEPEGLSWGDGQRLRSSLRGRAVVPAPPLVEELREVKDEAEIASIAEAARLGSETFDELLGELRPGMTEREVAIDLELGMRRRGAEALAFDSIVAFGEQAAEPHHQPGDRPLRRGDLIKLDFGARVDGYCSDMTRTVVLGPASERQREVYEVVHRAQAAGLAALRAGVSGAAIDRACREVIGRAGFGDAFSHPSGHGIGLEIHEAPRVRVGANGRISTGTPVTVEPGVYLPGFGGVRIEDLAVVRPGGHDVLTTATKELLEL
jgi:Xaa-Pro aminopeptidase/Xaa-Pro dipeptidase